jgi:tRNA threonylcarbamoyladenosine biosynthesis protein TsaE
MIVITENVKETEAFGECLGEILEPGDVVTLSGELGAGKSRLAQGIAYGLGVERSTPITSPTYTILNEYQGRIPLHHFDFYRFQPGEELRDLGFEEQFAGDGVCLVEWPERLAGELASGLLKIALTVTGESRREITITPCGSGYEEKIAPLQEVVKKCFDRNDNSCY